MAATVSKEEYLKRYLGESSAKKKTKKVRKLVRSKSQARSKIVDDDIDIKSIAAVDDDGNDDEYGDDAPEVVGVVDERPADVRKMEEFGQTKMWKVLGGSDNDDDSDADRVERQQEVTGRWSCKVVCKEASSSPQDRSRLRHDSGDSYEAERRHDSGSEESSLRKTHVIKSERREESPDQSPPRKSNHRSSDTDLSPPRKRNIKEEPPDSETDLSPPRRSATVAEPGRMRKTLDGKRAGLQDAATLRRENEDARRRESRLFEKAGDEVLGRHAPTVVRDRSTGKRRDFKAEEQRKQEAAALKEARETKYKQWNKGLKQVDMHKEKLVSDLHEISKPLTRYENDEDLDNMLKNQEREGDPMLAFIKKKNRKAAGLDPNKDVPKYNGPPAPLNRYGIGPGYRWDGVDRSNGFEKSRFTRQNDRKANLEQAYKWSVEDM